MLALLPLLLMLLSCGEPLRLPGGTPGPARTPLIGQAARQTATAIAAARASATAAGQGSATSAAAETPEVTAVPASPTALPTTAVPATSTPAPTDTDVPATATAVPASPTATSIPPSVTPAVVIVPATPTPQTNEQRWRAQQVDRQVLDPKQLYTARQPVSLLWWDPATAQVLEIGLVRGDFPVQATFTFRPTGEGALEVPYRINADFGLTSISDAVLQRMRAAGYTQTVEAFVKVADVVQPRQPSTTFSRSG